MGITKSIGKGVGNVLKHTIGGVALQTLLKPEAPQAAKVDPAAELEKEEEIKRKARQMAVSDLNPTGTLGAGKAQTTRSKVLGV